MWGWSDTLKSIGALTLLLAVWVGFEALSADHSVQGYTLVTLNNSQNTCVVAIIDWGEDDTVFCSDDTDKVLAVYDHLTDQSDDDDSGAVEEKNTSEPQPLQEST